MKTIAVFFDDPGFDDYPFNKEEYRLSYRQFGEVVTERGGQLLIVRDQKTYLGNNRFSKYWAYENGEWVEHTVAIEVDVIYDKGYFDADRDCRVVNDRELEKICTDKWITFGLFPDMCPFTALVEDEVQLKEAIGTVTAEKIVAKPIDELEGQGVYIDSPQEVEKQVDRFPYLIQEFMDTSGGIPGIVDGVHDFRVILIDGEPVLAFVRTPAPGGLLANVSQGGATHEVKVVDIPSGAKDIVDHVDAKFHHIKKRVYCIDMALDSDGRWKIIELNAKPGLFKQERGEDFVRFHEKLAEVLLSD